MAIDDKKRMARWRLVLGKGAEEVTGGLSGEMAQMEETLGFLYDREYGQGQNIRSEDRTGGIDGSGVMSVPDWINQVHQLFPQKTIERIEKDALERYKLEEMVTNPELLKHAQPSQTLLKAVLRTKHLMNEEVLAIARELIRKVVRELIEKLAREVQSPFYGTVDRRRRSHLKIAKNFDAKETVRRNLANYDPHSKRLFIKTPYFNSRVRRRIDQWQLIILVDESGSMMDSVIHSAICASIFWGIKSLQTHLVIFDTQVVDLTQDCADPVETLMKVQLGGGTNIGLAVNYAETLVENPDRTIIVLITDFYEGGSPQTLLQATHRLVESGVTFLGLAALDARANPSFDRNIAQQMANLGAYIAAMTPGELAAWVAEKVK
jgi:hypothetical protein